MLDNKCDLATSMINKYVEEFRDLDLKEMVKRLVVRSALTIKYKQSEISAMYDAYKIIQMERQQSEIKDILQNCNICKNLELFTFAKNEFVVTPFTCNKKEESLFIDTVKKRCLCSGNCSLYEIKSNEPIIEDKSIVEDETEEEDYEISIVEALKSYDQNDYHDLYYTKLFNEFDITAIQESLWFFLKENYPVQHKTNKMIAVLKKTLNDRDTTNLEYITYEDVC